MFVIAEAVSGAIDGLIKIGSYGLLIWLAVELGKDTGSVIGTEIVSGHPFASVIEII